MGVGVGVEMEDKGKYGRVETTRLNNFGVIKSWGHLLSFLLSFGVLQYGNPNIITLLFDV